MTGGIGSWQPDNHAAEIDRATLARLVRCAEVLDHPTLGLSEDEVTNLASLMRKDRSNWDIAQALDDDTLVALIRFFTVAEGKLPNWEAGDRSPVIALAAILRGRKRYPKELTAWIKAHTNNRFLPWGSVLDRL